MATLYDEINLMINEFWRGPKERWEKDTHDEIGKVVLKLIRNTHFVPCRGIRPKYFPSCTFLEANTKWAMLLMHGKALLMQAGWLRKGVYRLENRQQVLNVISLGC